MPLPRVGRWLIVALANLTLLALFLVATEIATRLIFPCDPSRNLSPWAFVPGVGVMNRPNELIRDTNRFDYCVEQRTNSLGFLDAEPPRFEDVKDKLRIALVGDSVVEATQVALADKFQTRLAHALSVELGIDASVVAWGVSGFGQVQELALFERFGLSLHPDIVVIVIVNNDLKNNSWLLQAIEDGVEPVTPYNIEIRPPDWQIIEPRPIDKVEQYAVRSTPKPHDRVRQWLIDQSVFYRYLLHLVNYNYSGLYHFLAGTSDFDEIQPRLEYLRRDPEFARLLAGWPSDEHGYIPTVMAFEHDPLPPAFDLAIRATERAMDQWVALAEREHFKIVAMLKSHFAELPKQSEIWRRILGERGIPLISQADFMARHRYRPNGDHFLRDGHWSRQGHQWASDSFIEFLKQHRALYLPDAPQKVGSSDRGG